MVKACDRAAAPEWIWSRCSQSWSLQGSSSAVSSLELVTCKQTDTSHLRGPSINQMTRSLLKSFCLVLTASIFFRHVMQEAATVNLLAFHFSTWALYHSRPCAAGFERYAAAVGLCCYFAFRKPRGLLGFVMKFWWIRGCSVWYHLSPRSLRSKTNRPLDLVVCCICCSVEHH